MSTLELVLLMLLVVDALALAALVLLQQGRGAEVGAAFGSGASNTVFGSSGSASFLTKLTVWLAIGFFMISFGLAWTAKERAANATSLGLPVVEAPAPGDLMDSQALTEEALAEEALAEEALLEEILIDEVLIEEALIEERDEAARQLTDESESVDSDIPDV